MAEYHVNNIEDFLTAVNTHTINDTVILDSDIDAQAHNFTSILVINTNIDGKGHTIYNVQASTTPFQLAGTTSQHIKIKDIAFKNILILGNVTASATLSQTTAFLSIGYADFENCQFQGKVPAFSRTASSSGQNFDKCFFEITCTLFHYNASSTHANYTNCYFILNEKTLNNTGSYGSVFSYVNLKNCYIKGNIEISSTDSRLVYHGTITIGEESNCYNFNLKATTSCNFLMSGTSGENICIYNSDKINSNVTITGNSKPCTDSEMHNAQALLNKGFNIIVG